MKYKFFTLLVFVLALFPYVALFKTPFDTQPWALLVAFPFALWLIVKEKRTIPTPLRILMATAAYAGVVYVLGIIFGRGDALMGFRALVVYVSIATFAFVGYATQAVDKIRPYLCAVGIWILAAGAQLVFGLTVVAHLVARFSSGGNRGLTALAPEPAFYAAYCAALLVLNEVFYREERYCARTYAGVVLLLIAQIVLSYSGVGMLLLVLFGAAKLVELVCIRENRMQKYLAGGAIVAVIVAALLFTGALSKTRAGTLVHQSIQSPTLVVTKNLSISRRLGNPILGLYGGLIEARGLGFGLGSNERTPAPAWLSTVVGEPTSFGGRIEGGLVSIVYELGVIGLLYIASIAWIVYASFRRNPKMRPAFLVSAAALFLPMTIFGNIAFPLFGYVIGIHVWYLQKK